MKNAASAQEWLDEHPIFKDQHGLSRFKTCLSWDFVLVNPKTNCIEKTGNTKLRCWMECGRWDFSDSDCPDGIAWHDPKLDIGANSFEKAIIKLAKKVRKYYGDYDPNPHPDELKKAEELWNSMKTVKLK